MTRAAAALNLGGRDGITPLMLKLTDIHIRDPFVLPVPAEGCYYLYGTRGREAWGGQAQGFDAYRSRNLIDWEDPIPAFRPPSGFWSDIHHWAPEVHAYRGRYYGFMTFYCSDKHRRRGTQILVSDSPAGPFIPHTPLPVTPAEWECLDGTLYVDPQGRPWLVFCHEWLQTVDGTMCILPLRDDLAGPAGPPQTLFAASSAPWSVPFVRDGRTGNYVTDGPFLHRAAAGSLLLLWSSTGRDGYAMGLARSATGQIQGPWLQQETPLFSRDGGHGMLFRSFGGDLRMTLHQPNQHPHERPVFLPVVETAEGVGLPARLANP
jgi:hypothetical protein